MIDLFLSDTKNNINGTCSCCSSKLISEYLFIWIRFYVYRNYQQPTHINGLNLFYVFKMEYFMILMSILNEYGFKDWHSDDISMRIIHSKNIE